MYRNTYRTMSPEGIGVLVFSRRVSQSRRVLGFHRQSSAAFVASSLSSKLRRLCMRSMHNLLNRNIENSVALRGNH